LGTILTGNTCVTVLVIGGGDYWGFQFEEGILVFVIFTLSQMIANKIYYFEILLSLKQLFGRIIVLKKVSHSTPVFLFQMCSCFLDPVRSPNPYPTDCGPVDSNARTASLAAVDPRPLVVA